MTGETAQKGNWHENLSFSSILPVQVSQKVVLKTKDDKKLIDLINELKILQTQSTNKALPPPL